MASSILALSAKKLVNNTKMDQDNSKLKTLPSVNTLLDHSILKELIKKFRYSFVLKITRDKITEERNKILSGLDPDISIDSLATKIRVHVSAYEINKLKPVINGTGILLHTNLGRAVLGNGILKELKNIFGTYSNLEFDLKSGKRGKRKKLFEDLIKDLLDVEDVAIVNNNAAAVFLCLKAIAEHKEVVVSRGELIEIGDSFRIPDIMNHSGVKMIEIGATNKTKLKDYENAITAETAVFFKTHRSNFSLTGFTEDAPMGEITRLGKKKNIVTMCDVGSGLLFTQNDVKLKNEVSVEDLIKQGFDLVMFSGDKLLGGPQCGIIVGRKDLISKIERHPLMRTYRVDKLTIIALTIILKEYLYNSPAKSINPTYHSLVSNDISKIHQKAKQLFGLLKAYELKVRMVDSKVQCGGGTLPGVYFDSYAIEIISTSMNPECLYNTLLQLDKPIVCFIKQKHLVIDLFCIDKNEISYIAESISKICQTLQ